MENFQTRKRSSGLSDNDLTKDTQTVLDIHSTGRQRANSLPGKYKLPESNKPISAKKANTKLDYPIDSTSKLEKAKAYVESLKNEELNDLDRDNITKQLCSLMINEEVYKFVCEEPKVFEKMYIRLTKSNVPETSVYHHKSKLARGEKEQEIYSVTHQLKYILEQINHIILGIRDIKDLQLGTEIPITIDNTTLMSIRADAITRLAALKDNEEVRMPAYVHRTGPIHYNGSDEHNKIAASRLNTFMSCTDDEGANIRVTQADRGRGAYISTDGDNHYGPHGVAIDPRDVHQVPLSDDSSDNHVKSSSERKQSEGHVFRATDKPITLTIDKKAPKHAGIFVTKGAGHDKHLKKELELSGFADGILSNKNNITSQQNLLEQLKTDSQMMLMMYFVHELNGIYEPIAWAKKWQNSNIGKFMNSLENNINKMLLSQNASSTSESDDESDEWK